MITHHCAGENAFQAGRLSHLVSNQATSHSNCIGKPLEYLDQHLKLAEMWPENRSILLIKNEKRLWNRETYVMTTKKCIAYEVSSTPGPLGAREDRAIGRDLLRGVKRRWQCCL